MERIIAVAFLTDSAGPSLVAHPKRGWNVGDGQSSKWVASYEVAVGLWQSQLNSWARSVLRFESRLNDRRFATLSEACTGRTPIAAAYAHGVGYGSLEAREEAVASLAKEFGAYH